MKRTIRAIALANAGVRRQGGRHRLEESGLGARQDAAGYHYGMPRSELHKNPEASSSSFRPMIEARGTTARSTNRLLAASSRTIRAVRVLLWKLFCLDNLCFAAPLAFKRLHVRAFPARRQPDQHHAVLAFGTARPLDRRDG